MLKPTPQPAPRGSIDNETFTDGQTSAPVPVHEALVEAMRAVPCVKKDSRNSVQGFAFRGIDDVLNAVGPALRDAAVVVTPRLKTWEKDQVVTARGGQMLHITVLVEYTFHGPAGDSITVVVPGEAFDSGDKALSKAMSVAFRTALIQTLALPTDEPDPDNESYEMSTQVSIRELLNEVARLAQNAGIERDAVRQQWASDHDGEDIGQTRNREGLLQLLATLREYKASQG